MTNEQLQNILKQYPEDCPIRVENDVNYKSYDIARIIVEYEYGNDFEIPILTLEYQTIEQ